jgi:transposase-like protein
MSKRAGREFWSRVVAEFERSSGETHAAFAARHGVEKATFERWLHLLRNERREKAASEGVRLLPVQVTVDRNEPMVLVELGERYARSPSCFRDW